MFQGSAGVHPFERVESDKFPQEVEEIVPSSSEDIPQLSAWVMFELNVVRQLGDPRPALLSRCSQSQEDLPQLVQICLSGQEGDPARGKLFSELFSISLNIKWS